MTTPRVRFRDPGECRIYKFTVNLIVQLVAYVTELGKTVEFTDAVETGLKLVIYISGKRSWRYRWTDRATKQKKIYTIGDAQAIPPDVARKLTREIKTRIAQGLPPDGKDANAGYSFKEFIQDYLVYARRKYKRFKDVESRIRVWLLPRFKEMALADITKAVVIRFHEELREARSATTANRTLSLLSSIMGRAVDLELIDRNPCKGVKKFKERGSRTRRLSAEELQRFMKVLLSRLDEPSARALYLLLVTAKRRSEILGARWSMIDLEAKTLTIPDPKNGRTDCVYLNSKAHELLVQMFKERDRGTDWVFPSNSKTGHLTEVRRTFSSIMKEAGIEGVRIHDLRRTTASILAESGATPFELMKILNHKDMRSTIVYTRLADTTIARTSEIAAQKIEEAIRA